VKAEPDNSAYLDTLGWVYYMMGKYNLALIHIKKSVEKREDSAVVVEHLGDVYHKLGSIDEARVQWKRALELDKENESLKRKIENSQNEF
jgi:tetratricopeptide (TPR) repeat protein